jgi:hypothetical protein
MDCEVKEAKLREQQAQILKKAALEELEQIKNSRTLEAKKNNQPQNKASEAVIFRFSALFFCLFAFLIFYQVLY